MKNETDFKKWISVIVESGHINNVSNNPESPAIDFTYKPDSPRLEYTPTYSIHAYYSAVYLSACIPFTMPETVFRQVVSRIDCRPGYDRFTTDKHPNPDHSYSPFFIYDKKLCTGYVRVRIDPKDEISEHTLLSYLDSLAFKLRYFNNAFYSITVAAEHLRSAVTSIAEISCQEYDHDNYDPDEDWDDDIWDNDDEEEEGTEEEEEEEEEEETDEEDAEDSSNTYDLNNRRRSPRSVHWRIHHQRRGF